jgi:hypothetical protein
MTGGGCKHRGECGLRQIGLRDDCGRLLLVCGAARRDLVSRRAVIADALRGLMRLQAKRRRRQEKRQQAENSDERVQRLFHLH